MPWTFTVREDTPDDIIKRIIEQFAPLKDCLPKSPLQKLESVITPWLKKLDRDVLLDTAEKLGVDVGVWPPDVGICSTLLARALLKGELPKVFDALRILAPQLDKNFAYNMITILAPSWVDERAVAPIPEVMRRPPKQRTVCVNGRKTFTGEMYIRRASGTFPSWSTLKVNNLSAEDQFGALMREIRAEYRKEIADDSLNDEDIDDLLNNLQEDLDPYFVVVPDYLDDEVLLKLREKYPRLTFFLLSGNQHLDTQELELKYIKFLQPALEPEQEKEAFRSYNHARAIVTSSHPSS